jgi:Transcriptional regulator, AbiEi antitoxin
MHPRRDVPEVLLRLAALQSNMVTREQVLGLGLSRESLSRLVKSGQWLRVTPGLFSTIPVAPSWDRLAWGGTLLGGPLARLGPEASGHLYGLVRKLPQPIDVLVPTASPVRAQGPWRFIRERDGVRSGRSPGSPPRLTAECTVLDLAAQRPADDVVGLVTDAVQKGLTNPERLCRALEMRRRQRHRRLIAGLAAEVAVGVESYLEVLYLRTVERPHGLPKGCRQQSHAGLPYQRDVSYDAFGLIVELDGRVGHEGGGRFRDMNRDNRHALRDQLTLRYGYYDVTGRPCSVAFQVYLALVRRGYSETFRRCGDCAGVPEAYLESA